MGKSEPSIHAPKSDSGYGDDPVIATAPQDEPFTHPLGELKKNLFMAREKGERERKMSLTV